MSIIHPFKAIRPHPPHAAEVSCPPYDVISTTEARDLVDGRPNSYLRVIRPEIDFAEVVAVREHRAAAEETKARK